MTLQIMSNENPRPRWLESGVRRARPGEVTGYETPSGVTWARLSKFQARVDLKTMNSRPWYPAYRWSESLRIYEMLAIFQYEIDAREWEHRIGVAAGASARPRDPELRDSKWARKLLGYKGNLRAPSGSSFTQRACLIFELTGGRSFSLRLRCTTGSRSAAWDECGDAAPTSER